MNDLNGKLITVEGYVDCWKTDSTERHLMLIYIKPRTGFKVGDEATLRYVRTPSSGLWKVIKKGE